MKVTMKKLRVTMRATHSKSRRNKEEYNLNGNLQNFKKDLIYILCLINSLPTKNKY